MSQVLRGRCHCDNLSFELTTDMRLDQIVARACDCRFCRLHSARNWSDPAGHMTIRIDDPGQLQRYLFALRTAEFFVCKTCGVYAGAVLADDEGIWSTVNLRLCDIADVPVASASYGAEDTTDRIARRKQVWTPTRIIGQL